MINKKQNAFSLIELVIVMAVIALIASFGWPAYQEQSRINTRTDGIIAANAVAAALNRNFTDSGIYEWDDSDPSSNPSHLRFLPLVNVGNNNSNPTQNNTCLQDRGFRWSTANSRYESCRGHYVIVVTLNSTSEYSIAVTPPAGTNQAQDTYCPTFTLNQLGVKGVGAGSSVKRCWGSS